MHDCPHKSAHAISFGVLLATVIGLSVLLYIIIGG